MERLTENGKIRNLCENDVYCEMAECQAQLLEKAINKLAEYENTGLEPKEVEQLKVNQNKLAIEKLEYLSQFLKEKGFAGCDNNGSYNVSDIIKTMTAELKGIK